MKLRYPLATSSELFPKGTPIRYATEEEILERIPDHNARSTSHSDWSMVVVEGLEKPIIISTKQIDDED